MGRRKEGKEEGRIVGRKIRMKVNEVLREKEGELWRKEDSEGVWKKGGK